MLEYQERLIESLLEKNNSLSYEQAQTWVELLWDDFETTYAKAGYEYRGMEVTNKVVQKWIDQYGSRLHEFVANNPKYKHLIQPNPNVEH
ncbi:YfhJ family protein [Bacillus timonensis]|nr:YfhJ family protein [Bacillus timonensis]